MGTLRHKTVVVERLHFGAARAAFILAPSRIVVLGAPDFASRLLAALLRGAGIQVEQPAFFAGDFVSEDGESVFLKSKGIAETVAESIARDLAGGTTPLGAVEGFGRGGALSLRLAKAFVAATASHMVNDLAADVARKAGLDVPFRITSLTDNVALISAIGNDTGYGNIFVNQLRAWFEPGDRLLAISQRQLPQSQPRGPIVIDNYPESRGIARDAYRMRASNHYIESGSIGLKICRVASGHADLFIKDVTVRDWDLAPAELILTHGGGV